MRRPVMCLIPGDMSELSDLFGAMEDLSQTPEAVTKVSAGEVEIRLFATSRLECWSIENVLLFGGELNQGESSSEKIQWGKGFYGLNMALCEGEWCATLKAKVGKGDTPEAAFTALFDREHSP